LAEEGRKVRRAAITGGGGFIESHLAEELINQGYQVIIPDDISTGKSGNIAGLLEGDSAEFIQGITAAPQAMGVTGDIWMP